MPLLHMSNKVPVTATTNWSCWVPTPVHEHIHCNTYVDGTHQGIRTPKTAWWLGSPLQWERRNKILKIWLYTSNYKSYIYLLQITKQILQKKSWLQIKLDLSTT